MHAKKDEKFVLMNQLLLNKSVKEINKLNVKINQLTIRLKIAII